MAESLLRKPQVKERTGLCNSALYALEGFPKPVKIGRVSAWIESEVDAWIQKQIANSRRSGGNQQAA